MNTELIKRMMDACYQAQRIRAMLPPLPEGVTPAYIHYLDVIETLEEKGIRVKVSDISDTLGLPRPGVTRTVRNMEEKGYLKKISSPDDGRVTYLSITVSGKELSETYNGYVFNTLAASMNSIPEADAECMIRTIETFHQIMCERRLDLDKCKK